MSIAEKYGSLTAKEVSALLIVRASGPAGYGAAKDFGTEMLAILEHLEERGFIEFKTVAVETPAGKAVRP